MPAWIVIDDPADARLDDYRHLSTTGDRRGTHVVAEGRSVVGRLLGARCRTRSLFAHERHADSLVELAGQLSVPLFVTDPHVMAAVAGFDVHRGVLAAAERPEWATTGSVIAEAQRLVLLEATNDLENLGAIGRSAHALGVDAVLLDPTCADPFARRSVRVSMGALLHLPVSLVAAVPEACDDLRAGGIETWALTPSPAAPSIFDVEVPERLALVAGAEGPGLTAAALASADRTVRIPMRRGVDSLNVGHALAIAMAVTAPSPR